MELPSSHLLYLKGWLKAPYPLYLLGIWTQIRTLSHSKIRWSPCLVSRCYQVQIAAEFCNYVTSQTSWKNVYLLMELFHILKISTDWRGGENCTQIGF